MPFTDEGRRRGGEVTKKHGIHALENRGAASLTNLEIASLRELKELVRTDEGKAQVKREITARLVLIARKMFGDMETKLNDPQWWESGVVRRGATYLAELRRWMDALPTGEREIRNVTDLLLAEALADSPDGAPDQAGSEANDDDGAGD